MDQKIDVSRSNGLLVMLYNEWRVHENDNRPLKIEWNIMHMFSSAQLAKLYAMKHNLDVELCSLIAILHDIAVVEGRIRKNHDRLAGDYIIGAVGRYNNSAGDNLSKISESELEIIIEAVSVHSDKSTHTDSPYVEMLKNVDSLDRHLYGINTEGAYADRTEAFLKDLDLI